MHLSDGRAGLTSDARGGPRLVHSNDGEADRVGAQAPETSGAAEPPLDNVGQDLRKERQRWGKELGDVWRVLKIRPDYLAAIEESRFEVLPGRLYAIGYVRSYARYLGLDAEEYVHRLKVELAASGLAKVPDLGAVPLAEIGPRDDAKESAVDPLPPAGMAPRAPAKEPALDFVPPTKIVGRGDAKEPVVTRLWKAEIAARRDAKEPAVDPSRKSDNPAHGDAKDRAFYLTPEPEPRLPQAIIAGLMLVAATYSGYYVLSSRTQPSVMQVPARIAFEAGLTQAPVAPPPPKTVEQRTPSVEQRIATTEPPAPAVTRQAPPVEQRAPSVEQRAATVEPPAPAVTQPAPPVAQRALSIEQHAPTVTQPVPPVAQRAPNVAQPTPNVAQQAPGVEQRVAGVQQRVATLEPPAPVGQPVSILPKEPATRLPSELGPTQLIPVPAEQAPKPLTALPPGKRYGLQNKNSRITLRVHRPTYVAVQAGRNKFLDRALFPGDTYRVPNMVGLRLTAQDAGAIELILDGSSVGFAGENGARARGLSLNPQNIADHQQRG